MNPLPAVSDEVLSAFLACRYKGYLKLTGAGGAAITSAWEGRSSKSLRRISSKC